MSPDTLAFLDVLLARCGSYRDSACLTLTAMHPDGQHPTPSRHIPLDAPLVLQDALNRLDEANRQGWGAFFGVGLRKMGLTRWRRGGEADVIALPALFADVDDPAQDALDRLQDAVPVPSCITATGGVSTRFGRSSLLPLIGARKTGAARAGGAAWGRPDVACAVAQVGWEL